MAKRKRKKKGRKKKRKGISSKNTQGGRKVRVKSHTRSPRGPNTGKKAVRVHGYARKKPRRGANAG
jgi:hypothetical protein